jgi:glutamate---cysteine ligase / carboxylate-amine ligase
MTMDETITIAALFQTICARIYMLWSKNLNYIQYYRALLNENKWRASRYSVDCYLTDFDKEEEVNTRALIYELLCNAAFHSMPGLLKPEKIRS